MATLPRVLLSQNASGRVKANSIRAMSSNSSGGRTHIQLMSGTQMPILGLGTWRSEKGKVYEAVRTAIQIGYRHIDCASIYNNQDEVGAAIAASIKESKGTLKREDLFITSKLWNTDHRPEHVEPACRKTLKDLGLDYLDLYLVHWPTALKKPADGSKWEVDPATGFYVTDNIPLIDTWQAMEQLLVQGLTKDIGVSNFSVEEVQEIMKKSTFHPVVNQVECHPYLPQLALQSAMMKHDVVVTAYSPLGNLDPSDTSRPSPLKDSVVIKMAEKYGCSPAQVLISWCLQSYRICIPKSITPSRIKENWEARKVHLDAEDLSSITALGLGDRQKRLLNPLFRPNGQPVFRD